MMVGRWNNSVTLRRVVSMLLALMLFMTGFGGFAQAARAQAPQAADTQHPNAQHPNAQHPNAQHLDAKPPDAPAQEEEAADEVEQAAPNAAGEEARKGGAPRTYSMTFPPVSEQYGIGLLDEQDASKIARYGEVTIVLQPAQAYADVVPVVWANGMALRGMKQNGAWYYRIINITCDIDITVNDADWAGKPVPEPEQATITLHEGAGYALRDITGGEKTGKGKYTLAKGGDFSFRVDVMAGYDAATLRVSANGQALEQKDDGTYLLAEVVEDMLVEIQVDPHNTYDHTVAFQLSKGVSLRQVHHAVALGQNVYGVAHGADMTFELRVEKGYDAQTLSVSIGAGELLPDKEGVYAIGDVRGDLIVDVAVQEAARRHTVHLAEGKGYTLDNIQGGQAAEGNRYIVNRGGAFSFQVHVKEGFDASKVSVKANGSVLRGEGGTYSIRNIHEDIRIEITVPRAEQVYHTVAFPSSDAFRVENIRGGTTLAEGKTRVLAGESLTFEVVAHTSYEQFQLIVRANGKTVKPTNGVYTLENIQEDMQVGIELNEALTRFSLTDKPTGVRVAGYSKSTPHLHVDAVKSGESAYTKLAAQLGDLKALGAYDVSLSRSKAEGDVTVTFPVDSAYNGRTVRVLRLTGKGNIAQYSATVRDGKATITAGALGTFMVAGVQDPSVILPPRTGDNDMSSATIGVLLVFFVEIAVLALIRRKCRAEEMQ